MNIEYAVISDIGKIRKENQDSVYYKKGCISKANSFYTTDVIYNTDEEIFAVFDGLGGEVCGGDASAIACSITLNSENTNLKDLCIKINSEICSFMKRNEIKAMGTTAALIRFNSKKAEICNIGDSKIFHKSENEDLIQLSVDHIINFGRNGVRKALTQYLGIDQKEMLIEPYTSTIEIKDGDTFLICTDGLTDMVEENEISNIMNSQSVTQSAKLLHDAAISNGGVDNISFVICKINI